MAERIVVHSTFVIERSYQATPERVFNTLADAAKKRRWFAHGENHELERFDMDFHVGGKEHARYHFKEGSPVAGKTLTHDATFLDIVPNNRVVMASTMSMDGHCFSASLVTMEVVESGSGTELVLTHQGAFFEGADGPEMRQAGWRKIVDQLSAELAR